ncbi:DNA translocase FtsK [Trichlorobacter thiogenes]|uniref:DNA translocase FtsK n=1 Tax=Trichlorobacter thiogenes TaxID=115783 RepID=A0A1T4JZK0_9BACT|nr:DNA translocase FtsK [Trichlorobacter thiogenes]SJZ35558.1 DNA translocase FtsK [Trichlorobacter thiogenes]
MDETRKAKLTKELQGIGIGAVGLFILLAFITFSSADQSLNSWSTEGGIRNLGGRLGAQVADLFFMLFGLASYLLPGALLFISYNLLRFKEPRLRFYKVAAFIGLLFSLASLFAFSIESTNFMGQQIPTGGLIGRGTVLMLRGSMNAFGALLVLLPLLAASIMILSGFSFVLFASWWLENLRTKWAARKERTAHAKEGRERDKALAEGKAVPASGPVIKDSAPPPPTARPNFFKKEKKKEAAKDKAVQESFDFIKQEGDFITPPLSLLDPPPTTERRIDREALEMNARLLEKKLLDFGIDGEVKEICPGPVITMYEFAPAPGIKISRIAGLSDDLTMALQALSIRIVAPIPGKGVVGIEVPNRDRETVYLREIFTCDDFLQSRMKLPLVLGKDIAGLPSLTDLAKAPHLLVAGSTGSGKSVSVNTMILSLLYTATPRDVRFIMVDPKMLEFSMYEGIPHLLLPVVTEPKKASLALKWAVNEMERRYRLLADKGVRNIESYNRKLAVEEEELAVHDLDDEDIIEELEEVIEGEDPAVLDEPLPFVVDDEVDELEHSHLPYIVVIVDELADLMMVAGREVEEHIARLAQKARAAGIHLILATQRPSVDVITGLIKANLPSRISFQVSSKVDSRTILDCNGAEALLGMGDMLYLPPGTGRLQRVHGAFVSDAEVQRVVDFLKKQGKPVYEKSILEMKDTDDKGSAGDDEEQDDRWEDALRLVAETKQASISMVQRRLRIGYNRAARIVEMMEREGMIAPSDGTSKPREIYMDIINAYLNSQLTR